MIVRRIEVMSLARVMGIIHAFIGLVAALPAGCAISMMGTLGGEVPGLFGGVGLFLVLLYPVLFGVMGFISGLLVAFVYNFVADRWGGIELEVDHITPYSGSEPH